MTKEIEERRKILKKMVGLETFSNPTNCSGTLVKTKKWKGFYVQFYNLHLNGLEDVPAICVRPTSQGPFPVVIYNHSHGGDFKIGKSEVIEGATYLSNPSFAQELCGKGYAVWAIDSWGFEERATVKESELFKRFLISGQSLWGMRLYDCIRLIDFVELQKDMDTTNLVSIGMSMGGLLSWWLSAIDERVGTCIDIAAQVSTEELLASSQLDRHGYYYYVPNQVNILSTQEIQQLIVPRKRISISGKEDLLCPVEGVKRLDVSLSSLYESVNKKENFHSKLFPGGHEETTEMREYWKLHLEGLNGYANKNCWN